MSKKSMCSVDGCTHRAHSFGLCRPHLAERRKSEGDLCSVDDCDEGRTVKSLCIDHYREFKKVTTTCSLCGQPYRNYGNSKSCGRCWRKHLGTMHVDANGARWGRKLPVHVPRPDRGVIDLPSSNRLFASGNCVACGTPFTAVGAARGRKLPRFCSEECRAVNSAHAYRARKWEAESEPYSREYVFKRDGWICQICDTPVDRSARYPDPFAPVVDHIVPLAAGGTDVKSNVQCAHARCNGIKWANPANDQLRLIG